MEQELKGPESAPEPLQSRGKGVGSGTCVEWRVEATGTGVIVTVLDRFGS